MSTLKIEECFELDAHPEQAWVFLTQPARIVVCLPGAELTEDIDERNYAGGVKVKLGAVTVATPGTSDPEHMLDNLAGGMGRLPNAQQVERMIELAESLPRA